MIITGCKTDSLVMQSMEHKNPESENYKQHQWIQPELVLITAKFHQLRVNSSTLIGWWCTVQCVMWWQIVVYNKYVSLTNNAVKSDIARHDLEHANLLNWLFALLLLLPTNGHYVITFSILIHTKLAIHRIILHQIGHFPRVAVQTELFSLTVASKLE